MDLHNQSITGLFPFIVLFSITFISHRTALAEDKDAELLKYRNSYLINKGVLKLPDVAASRRHRRGLTDDIDPANRATNMTTTTPSPPVPNPSWSTSATTVSTVRTTTTQTPSTTPTIKSTSSAANTTKTTKELPDKTTTVSPPPSTTPPPNTTSTGNQLTDQATLCSMSICILIYSFIL